MASMKRLQLLFACGLWPSAALVQRERAVRPSIQQPVVSGTLWLEPEELAGHKPLFVDAFLNASATGVNIILSYSPMYSGVKRSESDWSRWSGVRWRCHWTGPVDMLTRTSFLRGEESAEEAVQLQSAEEVGTLLHDSEPQPNVTLVRDEEHSQPSTRSIMGRELARQWKGHHHSMVVGCNIPWNMRHSSEWSLDITADEHNVELYSRRGISVRKGAFVKPRTEMVLCTMVNELSGGAAELLWPWAKYHAMAGFEQILIYVEDSNVSSTQRIVEELVQSGLVTMVPFHFGNVSSGKNFDMQAAMEQHCLYQARGRAHWLGHNDVDEFFDVRGGRNLKEFLQRLPASTPGINVRSQYWHMSTVLRYNETAEQPFPCYITCKEKGYLKEHSHSKWIVQPEMVSIIDPHIITSPLCIVYPDPDLELRLNHFRHCQRNGLCARRSQPCEDDQSFASNCTAALSA